MVAASTTITSVSRREPRAKDRKGKALEVGAKTVSRVGGTGVGLGGAALLGPVGALLGPATSTALEELFERLGIARLFDSVGKEFAARQLGPVQLARAEEAYTQALQRMAERLNEDEAIRDDGFFDGPRENDRPAAEELLEGVLQAAVDAYEQRKVERLGELYAFIAFNPDITPAHANQLLELAGRLTYRHLLCLGFFGQEEDFRSNLPEWEPSGLFSRAETHLVFVLQDLAREGLIVRDDNKLISSFSDINPRRLKAVLNGKVLYDGMSLGTADEEDIKELQLAFLRLGKVDPKGRTYQVEAVVPPGSPPEVKGVKIDKQVVALPEPRVLRLRDVDAGDRKPKRD